MLKKTFPGLWKIREAQSPLQKHGDGHTTITSQLDNFCVQTQQTKKTHENKGKYL